MIKKVLVRVLITLAVSYAIGSSFVGGVSDLKERRHAQIERALN